MPDINQQYEQLHLRKIAAINKRIKKIYEDAILQIKVGISQVNYNGNLFNVNDYPALKKRIESVIKKMQGDIYVTSVNGIKESWDLSNKKNNLLVDQRLAGKKLKNRLSQVLYDPNKKALEAFIKRKDKGMDLSDRVWNLLDPFKKELEQSIGLGLGAGRSAADIAGDVKRYLNQPDKLFRRVRGEDGQLHLSAAARNYHPGQGIYRSSFKNALRLTRTENNIAYRSADWERWQKMDFVIGIEIKTSHNHPEFDICDELKGQYPKDFKFTGWHPQCLCFQVPKLMKQTEFEKLEDQILAGEPRGVDSKDAITEPPKAFGEFLDDNEERIAGWKNKPYWIKDNPQYVKPNPNKPVETEKGLQPAATPIGNQFSKISDSIKDKVIASLKNIDEVHGDGALDDIPIMPERSARYNATFLSDILGRAKGITLKKSGLTPELSFAHEVGHYLDLHSIGTKGQWDSTSAGSIVQNVIGVAKQTDALKNIAGILKSKSFVIGGEKIPLTKRLRDHLNYLMDPKEIWARAYAQFISKRSSSPSIKKQLQGLLDSETKIPYSHQWQDPDFEIIEKEIEKMMIDLGWITNR